MWVDVSSSGDERKGKEKEKHTVADLEKQIYARHVTLALISRDKLRKEFYLHWYFYIFETLHCFHSLTI